MSDETITISATDYAILIKAQMWLEYLNAAGVDNWEGCSHAYEMMEADGNADD